MKTQKQMVLRHLLSQGLITTFIAFRRFGVTRLSERIRELESDGHVINHIRVTRRGKTYTIYSLVESRRARAA